MPQEPTWLGHLRRKNGRGSGHCSRSVPPAGRRAQAVLSSLVPLTARIESSRLGDRAALHGAIAVALREAHALLFTRATR